MFVNSRTCSSLSASPMTIRAYIGLLLRVFRTSGHQHVFALVVLFLREDLSSHKITFIAIRAAVDDLFRDGSAKSDCDNVGLCSRIDIDSFWRIDRPDGCSRHFLHLSGKRRGTQQGERNDSNELLA